MVTMNIEYLGSLRTESTHLQSGNCLITDAPLDNKGKGEAFSPTDLLASSLGSCMVTIMGIKAEDLGISIDDAKIIVEKKMHSEGPRRIGQININIHIPQQISAEHLSSLERSALNCPVAKSIHPDIKINFSLACE